MSDARQAPAGGRRKGGARHGATPCGRDDARRTPTADRPRERRSRGVTRTARGARAAGVRRERPAVAEPAAVRPRARRASREGRPWWSRRSRWAALARSPRVRRRRGSRRGAVAEFPARRGREDRWVDRRIVRARGPHGSSRARAEHLRPARRRSCTRLRTQCRRARGRGARTARFRHPTGSPRRMPR